MKYEFLAFPAVLAFLLAGCAATRPIAKTTPDYWPTEGWRTTTPERQGVDSRILAKAVNTIRERSLPVHSLLVVRGGYVVLDVNFHPCSGEVPHDIASVTKSVTSALVGLAIERGDLKGVEEKMSVFFPELSAPGAGRGKEAITIEHLLTMTSGMDCGFAPKGASWRQVEAALLDMVESKDFIRFALDLPMKKEPGSEFAYCSVNFHLLSAILARATGMSTADFARKHLFEPLGIRDFAWPADPSGIPHGWGDLRMHPKDMAKIGYLYRNEGRWEGRQLLSASWIEQSTKKQADVPVGLFDYGYGWWVPGVGPTGPFDARGRGGQVVVVQPEKDLVVVVTGAGYDGDVLVRLLRPALKSHRPLPEDPEGNAILMEAVAVAALPPEPKPVPALPATARNVSGKNYRLETNPIGIESVSVQFEGTSDASLRFERKGNAFEMPVGLDGVYRISKNSPTQIPVALKGGWKGEDSFVIEYVETAGPNNFLLIFVYKENGMTARIAEGPYVISEVAGRRIGQ